MVHKYLNLTMKVNIKSNEGNANAFNDFFFTKIGPVHDNEIPRKPMDPKIYLKNKIPHSFLITPTTPQEVYDLIGELDDNKSSGPCSIPSKFLTPINGNISIVIFATPLLRKVFSLTKINMLRLSPLIRKAQQKM